MGAETGTTSPKPNTRRSPGHYGPRSSSTRESRGFLPRRAFFRTVKRVVVLDYGSGNLRSAQRALERVGANVAVTSDTEAAIDADGLVVPGVGAFAACMAGLAAVDGGPAIVERARRGRPVLGICVGMQVLFDAGVEHG